jgi:hypothetical protein
MALQLRRQPMAVARPRETCRLMVDSGRVNGLGTEQLPEVPLRPIEGFAAPQRVLEVRTA